MSIVANELVLVKLPSGGMKIVDLKPGGIINLGKFGSFAVDEIIGHFFGQSFEIVEGNTVKPVPRLIDSHEDDDLDDSGLDDDKVAKDKLTRLFSSSSDNNQNIIDIGSKIQKLTSEDINDLKKSGATSNVGQLIIEQMIAGHEGFDKKTIFSQQKYLKRKQQKFLRRFTIERITSTQLISYYIDKDLSKLLDISQETVAMMMIYANIRPGGKYLLIDDTGGVILYTMLEKMNFQGTIVLIHENEHPNYSVLKHTNIKPETVNDTVKMINWLQFIEPDNERIDWQDSLDVEIQDMKGPKRSQYFKRKQRAHDINDVIDLVQQGNFDAMVSVTTLDIMSIIPLLIPKIGGSRPLAIYSQFKEVLLQAQHLLQADKRVLAPSILESRVRPYQTLPGRMHPLMTMRGYGGYLLWGTRVFPKDQIQAVGRGMGLKKQLEVGSAQ